MGIRAEPGAIGYGGFSLLDWLASGVAWVVLVVFAARVVLVF